jgi:hypothetical protein
VALEAASVGELVYYLLFFSHFDNFTEVVKSRRSFRINGSNMYSISINGNKPIKFWLRT